jgi:hypothetical protein
MRIEAREDCIAFLCECGKCDLPVAMLRRGRNSGVRIESQHHGQKHTNVLTADDLSWANLYISAIDGGTIPEGSSQKTARSSASERSC